MKYSLEPFFVLYLVEFAFIRYEVFIEVIRRLKLRNKLISYDNRNGCDLFFNLTNYLYSAVVLTLFFFMTMSKKLQFRNKFI